MHVPNDYMSYGGVSRPVVLEKNSVTLYFEYVHVKTYHKNGTMDMLGVKVAVNILDQIEAYWRECGDLTIKDR